LPTTRTFPPVSNADRDPSLGKTIEPADCQPVACWVGLGGAEDGATDGDVDGAVEGGVDGF
jgi:hypothetical protein